MDAYKRKDKVDLIRMLSVPLYDVFSNYTSDSQNEFEGY